MGEEPLDLGLFATNAVRFVPVELREAFDAAIKLDPSNALTFSPSGAAVRLSQASDFSNGVAGGDGLDMRDRTQDEEMHSERSLPPRQGTDNIYF